MNRVQLKIIEEALDQPEQITQWEYEFVSDLAEKSENENYELTEKQNHVLNKIGSKL